MIIVIDTNIVVKGFVEQDIQTLYYFLGHHSDRYRQIAIDFDGRMMKEYRDNTKGNKLIEKWLVHLSANGQVHHFDGKLPSSVKEKLLKLGFHEEADHVFVAVALNAERMIITEDSDYAKGNVEKAANKKDVLDYLEKELEMKVFDVVEFMSYLDQSTKT